jgi:predicted TIM-barrel fold metal-dependent hydrolase
MKIIDSHTHLGNFPLFNVSLNADDMIKIMDQHDISMSIVFSLPSELTLNAVKKYPNRLIGLIWVNPHDNISTLQDIDRAINEWNFRGIKMHPLIDSFLPDEEIVYPIMERARKYRIPVLFHCGHPPWSLPWHFGNLAEIYPDVTIILGHMGHGHIVYINGAIDVAKKYDNIILETSGMPMHSKIKEAVEKIGENRVIYGSDMPFGHPSFEIKKVEVSGLSKRQLELVLRENSCKIFGLQQP